MKTAMGNVKTNMIATQTWMKEYANRSRQLETFHKGVEVLLSTKNLGVDMHLPSKLHKWWIGPYKVTKIISPVAYQLDLPLVWQIHPVFNICNLKHYNRSTKFIRAEQTPSHIVIKDEEEYEVKGILHHKGKIALHWYLVLRKGYPLTKASWEPISHLEHAPLIFKDYMYQVSKSRGPRQ